MARQKTDTTAADQADAAANDTSVGLFAAVQDALNNAAQGGDQASYGALAAIETCIVDLRTRLQTLEQDANDDVKAVIEKVKAVL